MTRVAQVESGALFFDVFGVFSNVFSCLSSRPLRDDALMGSSSSYRRRGDEEL